jgi:hypothetical protein
MERNQPAGQIPRCFAMKPNFKSIPSRSTLLLLVEDRTSRPQTVTRDKASADVFDYIELPDAPASSGRGQETTCCGSSASFFTQSRNCDVCTAKSC